MKMPSSLGSSMFLLAAVLTALSSVAGAGIAAVAMAWELYLFYKAGS